MSNGNKRGEIVLKIHVTDQGGISVHGPIEDKILCFGLLEAAKITVANHVPNKVADRSQIIVPQIIPGQKING